MRNQFSNKVLYLSALILTAFCSTDAFGHDGRRLDIQVINNQLFAQGFLSNPQPGSDDGGGLVRPYFNSIHDHFTNIGGTGIASLPGFDITNTTPLQGSDVTLTLLGVSRWTPPALIGDGSTQDFGTPVLQPLSTRETLSVGFPGSDQASIDNNSLGSFTLASNIDASTADADLDLNYVINLEPTSSIYALRWQLSTTQPGIADSGDVYTVLAPDGMGFAERLHFPTLALEEFLGTPTTAVPEPSSLALLSMMLIPIGLRRRRS